MKSLVLAYIVVPAVAAATGFTAAQKMTDPAPSTYLNAVAVSTDVGAKTVTVRPKGGQSRTLHVDDAAAAQLGRLKAGDAVMVTVRSGRASEIRLAAAGRPSAAPTP